MADKLVRWQYSSGSGKALLDWVMLVGVMRCLSGSGDARRGPAMLVGFGRCSLGMGDACWGRAMLVGVGQCSPELGDACRGRVMLVGVGQWLMRSFVDRQAGMKANKLVRCSLILCNAGTMLVKLV